MQMSNRTLADHHGVYSTKRMHLQPALPIPVTYASAAVPTFAPFGTEYTPDHSMKIIGGRRIAYPDTISSVGKSSSESDPEGAPTRRSMQYAQGGDSARWSQQQPPQGRYNTTYRSEYIDRIQHPEYTPWYQQTFSEPAIKPNLYSNSTLSQYTVLPPIATGVVPSSITSLNGNQVYDGPTRSHRSDMYQRPMQARDAPPMNFNYGPAPYDPSSRSTMSADTPYLPEEPVLLTDFEEERLSDQVRQQIGSAAAVERLKTFYQELTNYDPKRTNYVYYSVIQSTAERIGLRFQEDTLRFAMCKFVSSDRSRGFVNYEDMIRYFGRCLSSGNSNPYGNRQRVNADSTSADTDDNQPSAKPSRTTTETESTETNDDEDEAFDPDERQVRVLLRQNLAQLDADTSIDFDKLTRELDLIDRNRSGLLNRQQIEEAIYKVRVPLQRTLTFQILEKHCRASPGIYRWQAFVRYLQEQVRNLKQVPDPSVEATQRSPRRRWLKQLRNGFSENDRLRVIERYAGSNDESRDNSSSTAWFSRFLRLANAMYDHRTSTDKEQEFVLPREEARRLFRAYNHVWDLSIDDDKLQRALDASARNGNTSIDEALQLLAK